MTKRELKNRIREAYNVAPSERKTAFLRQYRQRKLNYFDLMLIQIRYMGLQLLLVLAYMLLFPAGTVWGMSADTVRLMAAMMPAAALVSLTGLGRSEKYGMNELEMAARLSLRMVVIIRLTVIGTAGFIVMLSVSFALKTLAGMQTVVSFAFTGTAFLLTSALCMMLIRKWHSGKNIYGCITVAFGVSLIMLVSLRSSGIYRPELLKAVLLTLFAVSILWTIRETRIFIRESEELQWNLY